MPMPYPTQTHYPWTSPYFNVMPILSSIILLLTSPTLMQYLFSWMGLSRQKKTKDNSQNGYK